MNQFIDCNPSNHRNKEKGQTTHKPIKIDNASTEEMLNLIPRQGVEDD